MFAINIAFLWYHRALITVIYTQYTHLICKLYNWINKQLGHIINLSNCICLFATSLLFKQKQINMRISSHLLKNFCKNGKYTCLKTRCHFINPYTKNYKSHVFRPVCKCPENSVILTTWKLDTVSNFCGFSKLKGNANMQYLKLIWLPWWLRW